MKKLIKALCLLIVLSVCVAAQTSGDEYNKNEFFVGYSNQQVDAGNHVTFHGFEASYVRNVHRYFGIKADVSGSYRNRDINFTVNNGTTTNTFSGESKNSLYNFLGGIQVKDNATEKRFKPFAHALGGLAHKRSDSSNVVCQGTNCPPVFVTDNSEFGFGGAFGGGLDIKINRRIDFRAIQVDYNPVYTRGSFDNNVRFGIGFVFK